jgi:hypothetical protein
MWAKDEFVEMRFVAIGAFLRLLYEDYPTQTLFAVIFIISLYYYYDKKESKNTISQDNPSSYTGENINNGKIVSGKDLKVGLIIKMKGDYWAEIVLISKTTITVDDDGRRVNIPLRLEQKYRVN